MPSYRAAHIEAHLTTTDLATSTSPGSAFSVAQRTLDLRRVTNQISTGVRLAERAISATSEEGAIFDYIGPDKDLPFLISSVASKKAPAPETTARALVLTVDLSQCEYLRKTAFGAKHGTDVKIDVFYNGHLAACRFVSGRGATSARDRPELVLTFSGRRIDTSIERPWVILPSSSHVLDSERGQVASPVVRWNQIGAALARQAEVRGTDRHGVPPLSAKYLAALSRLDLPECLNVPHQGGLTMGFIDLVITQGHGAKSATKFGLNVEPSHMVDPLCVRPFSCIETQALAQDKKRRHVCIEDLADMTLSAEPRAKRLCLLEQDGIDNERAESRHSRCEMAPHTSVTKAMTGADDKSTLTMPSCNTVDPASAPLTLAAPKPRLLLRLTNRAAVRVTNTNTGSTAKSNRVVDATTSEVQNLHTREPNRTSQRKPKSYEKPTTTRRARNRNTAGQLSRSLWSAPSLSVGCTATYAEPEMCRSDRVAFEAGMLRPQTEAVGQRWVQGMFRQTPKEKPGEFREESLLCGMRFVVL